MKGINTTLLRSLTRLAFRFLLNALIFFQSTHLVAQNTISKYTEQAQSDNDSIRFDALKKLQKLYAYRNQDTATFYLDQLKTLVSQMDSKRHEAMYYMLKGEWCLEKDNHTDSARYYYQLSKKIGQKIDDPKILGSCYLLLGDLYNSIRLPDSAFHYYNSAEPILKKENSSALLAYLYNNYASVYADHLSNNPKAVEYFYKALEYSEKTKNIRDQSIMHLNIGNLLTLLDQFEEAEKELTIGIELSKKLENYDVQAYGYDLLYTLYSEIGNSDKAMFYAKLSFEFSEKSDNVQTVFSARKDLINLFIKNKSWNEALKQLKVNLEALNQLKFSEVQNSIYTKSIHLKLALCYHYLNKKNLSLHHLDLSEKVNIQFKELIAAEYINLVTLISKSYEELGLYKKSIEYYRLESELLDSIKNEENRRIVSELETKYETEKKEQEIASLQQAAEIQSLKLNSYLIGGGSLLLLFIGGGFLYYRQYKTKRDKASIELEQRFLRSQLNPHFIFNSMGAIQQYLLTESPEKASDYMSVFSRLMRQILENSREEFITLEEEISMLKNYLELQKLRFNSAFSYTITIDEKLDPAYDGIPPMFAQPFIENTLEHGLFKKDKNELIIKFSKTVDNHIQLEIVDTGIGITQAIGKANDHTSLATKITNERLEKMRITYKAELSLNTENITSEAGEIEGYRVRLSLPSKMVAA